MFNNKGFTMLEIVIVLALIGILTAIAVPGIKNWQEAQRVTSAAMGIRAALQGAKAAAIKNQTRAVVSFTPGTGSSGGYEVFIDDDSDGIRDAGEQIIRSESMNRNVTLYQDPDGDGFPDDTTQLNAIGLPVLLPAGSTSGAICVRNNTNTLFKKITLENTGNIKIEKSPTGAAGSWVK